MVYKYLNYLRHRVKAVIKCSSQLLKLLNSLFVWRIYQQKMSAEEILHILCFCDFHVHVYNFIYNVTDRTCPNDSNDIIFMCVTVTLKNFSADFSANFTLVRRGAALYCFQTQKGLSAL